MLTSSSSTSSSLYMPMEDGHEIVLFPFLAQGHIIPFIALANLIEQHTKHTITLVTTPLNILKIKPLLPPITSIHLTQLPFSSSDHGLPSDVENTDSLPFHLSLPFFLATESLRPSFDLLLSDIISHRGRENVTVIADVFLGWTVKSAEKLGVFHSVFVTSGAYGFAMFFSLWLHPPTLSEHSSDDDDQLLPLPDYPEIQITRLQLYDTTIRNNGLENSMNGFMIRQISHCCLSGGLLVNTAEEFEKAGLSLLRRSPGLPVWAIGPVSHPSNSTGVAGETKIIINWLGSKPPASVVYVSFGSQNSIPASQMMELAMGLEASGAPFVWVVRPPVEFAAASSEFRSDVWLPEGFEDRMRESNQGLIMRRWAPQREILSHASTGAFLSHCGWNSVIESLERGVPIIGWPIIGDQLYNSKMMAEMGVCVEVSGGRSSRMEEVRSVVERAIGRVIGETEESWETRRRVGEVRKMLRAALVVEDGSGGHSLRNLREFFSGRKNMKLS